MPNGIQLIVVANKYFKVVSNLLPKDDPRYIRWRESLKKRPPPWCKGKTKDTDIRVKQISDTFKRKKLDNFAKWRENARKIGRIPLSYPPLKKDEGLACLIGLALGDGHIDKFPRTDKFTLSLGTDKPDLINFSIDLIMRVFNKQPSINKPIDVNMVRLSLYQKYISKRLGIPFGNRGNLNISIPPWINRSNKYLLAYLRGLYEAEGSLSIHLPTYTYNFAFSNSNLSLLKNVEISLKRFGFHPEIRPKAIRLRRQNEVKYFKDLINFRSYDAGWSNGSLVALWKRRSRFES